MRISDWSSDVCSSDLQLALDAGHEPFHAHGLHGALAAGDPDGTLQLFAVEGLALAALLHHHKFAKLHPLEGGEARAAAFALPAPANGSAVLGRTAVLHLTVVMGAEGAAQVLPPRVDREARGQRLSPPAPGKLHLAIAPFQSEDRRVGE